MRQRAYFSWHNELALAGHTGLLPGAEAGLCHALKDCLGIEHSLPLAPALLAHQGLLRCRLCGYLAARSQAYEYQKGCCDAH
jgi:hypothetical protein